MRTPRYLTPAVEQALATGKMAFIGGPRQVGKTTLALSLLGRKATERHPAYFNWDDPRAAARLRRVELPAHEPLLICDEVHKNARWRNLLKGIYDTEKSFRRIIVTGSARLDYYRKGGDSLANRYRYFRLHPFSLRELDPRPTAIVVLAVAVSADHADRPPASVHDNHGVHAVGLARATEVLE